MTHHELLSDFEINCEVAMIVDPILCNADEDAVTDAGNGAANFRLCDPVGDDHDAGTYDYCNNPSDAWPIIFESRIFLAPLYLCDEWKAVSSKKDKNHSTSLNPLRAAMIVFLKMNEHHTQ